MASGSRFCSICGSSTEPVAVSRTPSSSRTDSLLAEATLFRLRSRWTDAEKRCVDVMRLDARNVHAHSLLGDIYRDQGKADEARQWYQMALDLEPDNSALKTKVHEATQGKPRRSKPAPLATPMSRTSVS